MRVILPTLLTLGFVLHSAVWAAGGAPVFSVTTRVDFGKDSGQNFGTLFEARDAKGRVLAGAGFLGVYNTMFRGDRHVVQFYVRPKGADAFKLERLPRPSRDAGLYLYDLDGTIHTFPYCYDLVVRSWNAATGTWKNAPSPVGPKRTWGHMRLRLGKGLLQAWPDHATWNGKPILGPPKVGRTNNYYYGANHLIFYHTHRTDKGGAFTRLTACPWKPGDGPIDMAKARTLKASFPGETPFAYGVYKGEVVTCSNRGGVYAFDGTKWRTIASSVRTGSFQVYSMLNYHDKLLLAQYPSGEIFEYDGKAIRHLKGWPPRMKGVSGSSRECQTLSIYRGDLIAGVWPWGEVWRYDRDAKRWKFMTRLFTHPEPTDKFTHPYEAECKAAKIRHNQWGQRVTGMAPLGESLMLSTCAYGAWRLPPKIDKSGDKKWLEYGAVVKLTLPGNLAARMAWKGKPTELKFVVTSNAMQIVQDGKTLATTPLDPALAKTLKLKTPGWGKGVFGPLDAKLLSQSLAP